MEKEERKILPLPKERKITAVLGDAGEVTGFITIPRKNRLGVSWVAMFQDGLEWLSKQDLTGEQLKVLMYLMSKLDFDNYLKVSQKEVAENLCLQKSHVSRAVKRLIDLYIILPGPMVGHSKTYRLSPRIAHRGAKNYKNTVIEYERIRECLNGEAEKRKENFKFHPAIGEDKRMERMTGQTKLF